MTSPSFFSPLKTLFITNFPYVEPTDGSNSISVPSTDITLTIAIKSASFFNTGGVVSSYI